jgi:hypothetical protein
MPGLKAVDATAYFSSRNTNRQMKSSREPPRNTVVRTFSQVSTCTASAAKLAKRCADSLWGIEGPGYFKMSVGEKLTTLGI